MNLPDVDDAMFNGPLGAMVDAIDPHTEASKVGVLASLLSAFSAYIGHGTRLKTGKGLEPLMFWPVLIGESGVGRKGTATKAAKRVVSEAFKAWSTTHVMAGPPETGLGFVTRLSERADQDNKCAPLWLIQEEMDTFITKSRRDATLGTHIRTSWDGTEIVHKTGTSDLRVLDTHISIIGHVQPRNWGTISGGKDASGGTWNRFFPLAVERSKTVPVFLAEDDTEIVREQGAILRSIATYAREVPEVRVPNALAQRFEDYHRPACEALTATGTEELRQMCERSLAYMMRIAALYALFDRRDTINESDFDAALALVRYSVQTVVSVLPDTGGMTLRDKIARAVERFGTLTAGELWDVLGHGAATKAQIANALLDIPQIQKTRGQSTGGAPPILYTWVEEDDKEPVPA